MDRSPTWASHLRDALHPYSLTARSPPCSDIWASFVRVRAETNWVCRPRNRRIRDHYALSRASGSAGSPRCPQDPKSSKRVGLTRRSRCNPAPSALSSPAVDPLEERFRVRQRAASALAQGRLAKLPQAVALLRALGAERVWLFGSLSTGAVHEGSDVDFHGERAPCERAHERRAGFGGSLRDTGRSGARRGGEQRVSPGGAPQRARHRVSRN